MASVTSMTARRVKNLGNYETQAAEVTVALEPGDDPKEVFTQLLAYVSELAEMDAMAARIAMADKGRRKDG